MKRDGDGNGDRYGGVFVRPEIPSHSGIIPNPSGFKLCDEPTILQLKRIEGSVR